MRGKLYGALVLICALGGMLSADLAAAQSINSVLQAEGQRIKRAQQYQSQIDKIAKATRAKFDETQKVLKDIDGLVVYNKVQQNLIDDQNQKLRDLHDSMDKVSVIERQVYPLMTQMIDGLQKFIELDVPFLKQRRLARVAMLRHLINRSDVTTAEKFRNVMQAWQDEVDYGNTSEMYKGEVTVKGETLFVNFLRVGRVALLYMTPDGRHAGMWNKDTHSWQPISSEYLDSIRKGFDVIKGNGTPQVFMIPVPAPEEG